MAPMYNTAEPRLKLSKPRPRTIGATPSPGESRSDLKTWFARESSPAITEFPRLQYNTRQGDRPLRKELDSEEENDIDIGRSLRKRFSRSQTAISKRSSLKMSLGLNRSLAFDNGEQVREYGSDENINSTIVRRAFRDELATLNQPLEITIEEDSVPERVISPIRRRSFFTPGLATRNPADMLAKPPKPAQKQQVEFEYYYNPKCSTFSPLERIAALDLAGRPETPQARATTPADLDYGLIGRLRITNGMASPTLSSRSGIRRASTGLCNSVNYSDMPHLSLSEESIIQSYLHSARQSGHFQHPLKIMSTQQDTESWHDDSFAHAETPEPKTSGHLHQDERETKPYSTKLDLRSASPSQDITSQIARDYMLGLADNPFGANPSMLNLQATSKPSEMEADLFDDASLKPRESYETLQKSDFVLPDVIDTDDDFEKRTSKLLDQIGALGSPLIDHASLSNADSGYSSSSSVSSFGKKFQASTNPAMIEVPKTTKPTAIIQGIQQMTTKAKRRPTPVTIQTSTTIHDSPFSRSIQSSIDTLPTAATTISFSTQIPQLTPPRKLQKPRPRSLPPPSNRVAFQMHPEIDPNVIPQIPNELAARMARRVEELPPLNHTLPSVDHLRLKKVDFDHPPLSAPIRFPSPQPMTDKLWAQVIKAQGKKSKSVRSRRSHMDGLLFHGRRKKSLNVTESAPNLASPDSDQRFPNNESYDTLNSTTSHQVDDFRSQNRSTMMRSKSMGTGLGDHDTAALSHVRSMAKAFDVKPLLDSTRKSSSVYNDTSSAIAHSVWTDTTPDLRQSSSVSTLVTKSTSLSQRHRAPIVVPHTAPLPLSPVGKLFTATNQTQKFHQLYESSSDEDLNQQQEAKSLPPLPLMPVARHTNTQEGIKKSRSLEKTLPLLPHQKRSAENIASRESSLYSDKIPVVSSSSSSTSTVTVLREAVSRHTRMQSEPPYFPSEKQQQDQYQSAQSPGIYRQPTLPELDTTLVSHEQHYQNLADDYKLQSSYNRYLSRTRKTRSESPEHVPFAWSPTKPEVISQSETHQEWPPSAPPKSNIHDAPRQSPTVPEGLVARMSGRFEGGLCYNYEPGHGVHGSAGTRSMQTGMRKSVETSKGYGLDLTDIPIFIYAQGKNEEHKQSGGWF